MCKKINKTKSPTLVASNISSISISMETKCPSYSLRTQGAIWVFTFSRYKKPQHWIALELFSSLAQLSAFYTQTQPRCAYPISYPLNCLHQPQRSLPSYRVLGYVGSDRWESSNCHPQGSCLKIHSSVLPTELKRPPTCFETKIWSCCGRKSHKDRWSVVHFRWLNTF